MSTGQTRVMIAVRLHLTGGRHRNQNLVPVGHQASKNEQLFEMVKWQPHGLKITTWMIKYPHIKKNAQHGNTPYYRASKPLSTSMVELIIITYYSIAVPVGIWAMMR